jgi:hypothetical protein
LVGYFFGGGLGGVVGGRGVADEEEREGLGLAIAWGSCGGLLGSAVAGGGS